MILSLVAPGRWAVRLKHGGPIRGFVERHKFTTYTADGKPKKTGFWIGRSLDGGWRQASVLKCKSREEAIKFVLGEGNKRYQDRRMTWKEKVR